MRYQHMPVETLDHLQRSSRRFAVRTGVAFWLRRTGFPRLAMTAIVFFCAAVGMAATLVLRDCGVEAMWLRYPLAWAASYGTFLLLLGVLVCRARQRIEASRDPIRRESLRRQYFNEDSEPPELSEVLNDYLESARQSHHNPPGGLELILSAAVMLMSLTIVIVSIYFIWIAPTFLAELVVEGGFIAWLYSPRCRGPRAHWFPVAFESTGIPALMIALVLFSSGVAMHLAAPQSTTIGEAVRHIRQQNQARIAREAGRHGRW